MPSDRQVRSSAFTRHGGQPPEGGTPNGAHGVTRPTASPATCHAFTLVEITAYPGRSAAAKRALFQALARRFEGIGIAPRDLFVVISEPPLENWSVRDGVSSADVKPTFKLDV